MHPFFESRVVIVSACWIWRGSVNNWGYGRTETSLSSERAAHRLSWELHKSKVPAGINVLHRCDTPRCVNPNHLFLGTLSENTRDCVAKGRHITRRGESCPIAKLSTAAVNDLRSRTRRHGSMTEWEKEFKVSRRAIQFALEGSTWR
jgi:HNH endonuclease